VNASTDEIAVIRTRLPYTDRRALSQAWFSAMHCVSESVAAEERRNAPSPEKSDSAQRSELHPKTALDGTCAASQRRTFPIRSQIGSAGSHALERSFVRRPLVAREIAEEPSREKISHVRFMMTVAGARVALHVRRDGGRLIVIAVCSSRRLEVVRRALAEAVCGLRLQGERVDTTVRAVEREDRP
jgi:hypothetical protein